MKSKSRRQIRRMKTTMNRAGRVTIPVTIRRNSGIDLGSRLDVRSENGAVVVRQGFAAVEIVRKGKLYVAIPTRDIPSLSGKVVEGTRKKLRKQP